MNVVLVIIAVLVIAAAVFMGIPGQAPPGQQGIPTEAVLQGSLCNVDADCTFLLNHPDSDPSCFNLADLGEGDWQTDPSVPCTCEKTAPDALEGTPFYGSLCEPA